MGSGNYLSCSYRRYYGFCHPLMTMEYRCFGYRKGENESEEVDDGYSGTATDHGDSIHYTIQHDSHIVKYACFKRHAEYAQNPLFWLFELLMKIISVLRVTFAKFLILGYIVLAILGWHESPVGQYVLYGTIALYAASIVIPILGFIIRKIFRLDQETDDICMENGWKRWSKYENE